MQDKNASLVYGGSWGSSAPPEPLVTLISFFLSPRKKVNSKLLLGLIYRVTRDQPSPPNAKCQPFKGCLKKSVPCSQYYFYCSNYCNRILQIWICFPILLFIFMWTMEGHFFFSSCFPDPGSGPLYLTVALVEGFPLVLQSHSLCLYNKPGLMSFFKNLGNFHF